jgi:hypothetical protein
VTKQYKVIELTGLDEETSLIVDALIHEGELRERERICRIIDANVCKCTEDCTRIDMFGDDLIALIRGERVAHLENLRRLADETGEYDSFYNPLIKGDDK